MFRPDSGFVPEDPSLLESEGSIYCNLEGLETYRVQRNGASPHRAYAYFSRIFLLAANFPAGKQIRTYRQTCTSSDGPAWSERVFLFRTRSKDRNSYGESR